MATGQRNVGAVAPPLVCQISWVRVALARAQSFICGRAMLSTPTERTEISVMQALPRRYSEHITAESVVRVKA